MTDEEARAVTELVSLKTDNAVLYEQLLAVAKVLEWWKASKNRGWSVYSSEIALEIIGALLSGTPQKVDSKS